MAAFFLLVSLHTHPVDFEPTTLSSTLFYGWKEVSFEPKFIGKKKKNDISQMSGAPCVQISISLYKRLLLCESLV